LLDAEYPRSLAHQIQKITELCESLPVSAKPGFLSTTEKILLQLKASFALADRQTLNINTNQAPSGLVSLLKSVTSQLHWSGIGTASVQIVEKPIDEEATAPLASAPDASSPNESEVKK
ncbi:MAG: alpha-E domain-containing protein, partial [Pseudomonadota bacterium]|nr:alpha-E domain-containing protein [Pseudomonadota bacterium]